MQLTSLHSAQAVELPLLEGLERFFDTLFEAEPLSVEFAHGDAVVSVGGVRISPRLDVWRLGSAVRIESLRNQRGDGRRTRRNRLRHGRK